MLSGRYWVIPAWNVLVCSVDGNQLLNERRRARRLWRHTFVRGFPDRPWEYRYQLVIRLIRACQAVRSIDSGWVRLITGVVAKYAGRVGRESACVEGATAIRWYGPDPEVFGRRSLRDVDRFCFYDDVVPLSYGARFSSKYLYVVCVILTNTDKDLIGLVRNDWHEVTAHDSDLVIVYGKYHGRIHRRVDQPEKVFFALIIAVTIWADFMWSK